MRSTIVKRKKEVMKKMGKFNINEIRGEINKIQKSENKSKRGLSTLLQFYQGKPIKLILTNGETIEGVLTKYSLYEIEVENKEGKFVIWKQNIKYMMVK